jgi:hypothetical protein
MTWMSTKLIEAVVIERSSGIFLVKIFEAFRVTIMAWTNKQKLTFRKELIEAYHNPTSLRMFVMDAINASLNTIVKDANIEEAAFELIEWAESKGYLDDLLAAFCEENPNRITKLQSQQNEYLKQSSAKPNSFDPLPSQFGSNLKSNLEFEHLSAKLATLERKYREVSAVVNKMIVTKHSRGHIQSISIDSEINEQERRLQSISAEIALTEKQLAQLR